ncbi:hypothetical protein EYF80_000861 [Liparis tanakae]|uniref:Uncharacterized protein n=1 Tax=Liparis tanakae TaxID=230148 RepID=A0A4Z2JGI6_9TELE|nr:hypothetical protein EYF80_000861 [Liparis tanakae]
MLPLSGLNNNRKSQIRVEWLALNFFLDFTSSSTSEALIKEAVCDEQRPDMTVILLKFLLL